MAGDDQRAEKYIMEIPYSVLLSIYQSLDADKGWEKLAAESGYTFDKIRLLELEGSRSQGSASRSLLWELSSRNTTVRQLYGRFHILGRYREMKILEDYVHNPSNQSFVDYGLKGLPDVAVDTSNSLKVLKSQASKKSSSTSSNNSSCVQNNSVNFNHQVATSDVNISMKCQQTDKYYPGKLMPFLPPSLPISPSPSTPSSVMSVAGVKKGPTSIVAPMMKPMNPGVTGISNVPLVQNMLLQIPKGDSGSSPSSSASSSSLAQGQTTSSSSASTSSCSVPQSSDSPFSSGMSSLPGLESSFDVQMAFMGSACFSYSEVLQATSGFSESNKLGEGAFGKVYFGVLRKNKCAVKRLMDTNGEESVVERSTQIKRELTSLLKYRHENIVTLYGYAVDGESLCLIYQYMSNGSLEDRLLCKNNTPPLVWAQRLNILVGACQGLNFLHTMGEQPLIHGDIKSANILLDKHMEAKIGDLGQAQQANGREGPIGGSSSCNLTGRMTHITRAETKTKLYGTRAYQPREVQTGSRPSVKSDIFAMGVVMLEVFSGEKAFDERREGEQFLADYFRSLKGESGDEACVSKVDRGGGDCPREVCVAILSLADQSTSHLKRHRPDSSKLLQKITEVDELYAQMTGIKTTGGDSLPGSVHSCHLSHCSTPAASVPNLSGAPPPPHNHPQSSHPHTTSKTINNVNMNEDKPVEKHYAMHLRHEDKGDNRLKVTEGSEVTLRPSARQLGSMMCSQRPIDYFQNGQPLPTAFILQQAYDSQLQSEKRRISRLSQCCQTRKLAHCHHEERLGTDAEVLPQSDPAKLAALEQGDSRDTWHGLEDSSCFQSDPKKLAALKQFDEGLHGKEAKSQHQAVLSEQDTTLASDPVKLAQLRLFDEESDQKTAHNERGGWEEEGGLLASDPRKLAALMHFDEDYTPQDEALESDTSAVTHTDPHKLMALMQFDDKNCPEPANQVSSKMSNQSSQMFGQIPSESPHISGQIPSQSPHMSGQITGQSSLISGQIVDKSPLMSGQIIGQSPHVSGQIPNSLSVGNRPGAEHCGQDPSFPVSAMDYIVASSQREALEACQSVHSSSPRSQCLPGPERAEAGHVSPARGHNQGPAPVGNLTSDETLLLRQKNFFEKYYLALENMSNEEEEGDFECGDCGNEEESGRCVASAVLTSRQGEECSPCIQEQTAVSHTQGHSHPVPSEQDESVLNYYKQRQQRYEKTFSKPQLSQC